MRTGYGYLHYLLHGIGCGRRKQPLLLQASLWSMLMETLAGIMGGCTVWVTKWRHALEPD